MKELNQKLLVKALVFIIFLITISSVNAIDVTLNPNDPNGVNGAIANVIANGSSNDTITINPGTYNKTTDRNNNITFNNKNLTIKGNGPAGSVIIDAQKAGQIFNIIGNNNITFINITFRNGHTTDEGGAIFNYASKLTLLNCVLSDNVARTGGGIYNLGFDTSNSSIINCIFSNNQASLYGGAINNVRCANMTINNSNFFNNRANDGGGIYNTANALIVSNSIFTNNIAYRSGGAIFNQRLLAFALNNIVSDGISHNVVNSSFINNFAEIGGAIYNRNNPIYVDSCNFIGNNLEAINFESDFMDITNSNFTNNGLAINLTSGVSNILGCNIFNNQEGIKVQQIGVQQSIFATINYNRIFNNTNTTGFNLDSLLSNINADFNWWGDNKPLVSGLVLNNYFVMNVTNITSLVSNGTTIFSYQFNLNTGGLFNPSLLPYFVTNVFTNATIGVVDNFDARFDRTVTVTLNTTGDIIYTFVTDNEIQSLEGVIEKEPTEPGEPGEPEGPVGPGEPSEPGEPEGPVGPGEPGEPEGPVEPEKPSEPGEPEGPVESEETDEFEEFEKENTIPKKLAKVKMKKTGIPISLIFLILLTLVTPVYYRKK